MKARVDADFCTGCEECTLGCPEVFTMGDDYIAKVIVDEVPVGLEAKVKLMADSCPVEAIEVD